MKLSGNKKNGRHIPSGANQNKAERQRRRRYESTGDQRPQQVAGRSNRPQGLKGTDSLAIRAAAKKKRRKKARRILLTLLLVIIALSATMYSVWKLGVKPPPMKPRPANPTPSEEVSGASPSAISSDRKGTQYTFAIVGFDDGNGNMDTIMVANFDADNYKLNVVSIPRDTLVNVSWNLKKANTLYSHGGGIEGVISGLADILGFPVDFYVQVDLRAFEELVDAVGGVEFDVPMRMYYHDPAQDLLIDLQKGPQNLNGKDALGLVRYRKGYADADIGRIRTQQAFLKAAAEQILAKQKELDLNEIVGIFLKYVKTDLSAGNLVWLGKEFYKMDSENITFTTIPAKYDDYVNHTSYVTIRVKEWLEVLNEKLNPFKDDITDKDTSILTRGEDGNLYVTNGVWAGKKSWGGGSSGGGGGAGASPSKKPAESAKPSASPGGNASPSPEQPSPEPTGSEPQDSEPPVSEPAESPPAAENPAYPLDPGSGASPDIPTSPDMPGGDILPSPIPDPIPGGL